MRSSRALHTWRAYSSTSLLGIRSPRRHLRKTYCSACDPPLAKNSAASTTKPLPKAPADHRILGVQQELFTTSKYSPGSTIFLPNGTKIFNRLTNYLRSQYEHFGFQEVITPTIYKKSLWEKSGHWENYAEDMYSVTGRGAMGEKMDRQVGEDEEYGLKPMNCPGHCLIFASKKRSYKDLPVRFADFSPLHRNELTGALSGLTRGRRFHQDDGHIFCRPSQIREEISKSLQFVRQTYSVLGLGPYRLVLSTRPSDSFIGTIEEWDNAETALKESLDASGQVWMLNEGDGAFYGPKIDIILKDSDGKEHQTATIQLDFQLPKRFELEYQAPAPELEQKGLSTGNADLSIEGPVTPVLIHRAVLGSVERIMALMIERYDGWWPFWLNPQQAIIVTLNDREEVVEWAKAIKRDLLMVRDDTHVPEAIRDFGEITGLSIDIDDSAQPLKKKLYEAKRKRYGVVIVVGNKDVQEKKMSVDFTGLSSGNYDFAHNIDLLKSAKIAPGQDPSHVGIAPLTERQLKNMPLSISVLKKVLRELRHGYY